MHTQKRNIERTTKATKARPRDNVTTTTAQRDAAGTIDQPLVAIPPRKIIIPRPDVLHTYLDYRQINQYLEFIANRYSHFVKMHTLGLSHERREVRALEINWMNENNKELPEQLRLKSAPTSTEQEGNGPQLRFSTIGDVDPGRNIVFIEAGTHAREWITISTALNCIYQLAERYTRNIEVLRKLRFIIVPLVNPDGYEYARLKNCNWRKNRRPHKQSKFVGTDCNRNYDFFWECGPTRTNRNTYKGEKPFSEPETRAMRNFLDRLEPKLLFFLSLHSYGQCLMYPWGYCKEQPHHWRELHTLATSGRLAIKSYSGREYRTGSISHLTNRTIAGSVVDYVYGVLKAPLALVMELPSRDLGFQPPVEMISQISHESWFGIREMAKRAYDLRPLINRESEPKPSLPLPPIKAVTEQRTKAGKSALPLEGQPPKKDSELTTMESTMISKKKAGTPKKDRKRTKRQFSRQTIVDMQRRSTQSAATATIATARHRINVSASLPIDRFKTPPFVPPEFRSNLPMGMLL